MFPHPFVHKNKTDNALHISIVKSWLLKYSLAIKADLPFLMKFICSETGIFQGNEAMFKSVLFVTHREAKLIRAGHCPFPICIVKAYRYSWKLLIMKCFELS